MKAYWQYQEKFRNTAVRHKRYERLMRNKPAAQAVGADPSLLRRVDLGVWASVTNSRTFGIFV